MNSDREVNSGLRNHVLNSNLQRQGQKQQQGQAPAGMAGTPKDSHPMNPIPRTVRPSILNIPPVCFNH